MLTITTALPQVSDVGAEERSGLQYKHQQRISLHLAAMRAAYPLSPNMVGDNCALNSAKMTALIGSPSQPLACNRDNVAVERLSGIHNGSRASYSIYLHLKLNCQSGALWRTGNVN
ncbi:hypothetical protein SKAU_G00317290 [Synaphobranchus kaupii]|uniref:Uncharacterized protein n=1 Tax=Synaphobranchus kaupii TaxID=118154 RepID=A0A9Q1ESU8_SYNKA|nr:hypothetical protein SKAU_G00317290 [Synaphobranchus kaupii]